MKKPITFLAIFLSIFLTVACNGDVPAADSGTDDSSTTTPDGSGTGAGGGSGIGSDGYIIGGEIIMPSTSEDISSDLYNTVNSVFSAYGRTAGKADRADYYIGSVLLCSMEVVNDQMVYTFGPATDGTEHLVNGSVWNSTSGTLDGEKISDTLNTTIAGEWQVLYSKWSYSEKMTMTETVTYTLDEGSTIISKRAMSYYEFGTDGQYRLGLALSPEQEGIKEIIAYAEKEGSDNTCAITVDGTSYACTKSQFLTLADYFEG